MATLDVAIDARGARRGAAEFERATQRIVSAGRSTTRTILGIASAFGLAFGAGSAIRTLAQAESALVGVGRTADLQGDALERLGESLRQVAFDTAVANRDILELATTVGQFGVRGEKDIARVTEALARLQVATQGKVAGEEGARSVVRILGLTQTSIQDVDRFSSALAELGDTFVTNEALILRAADKIASSIGGFKPSAQEVLAISAALTQSIPETEILGSALQAIFLELGRTLGVDTVPELLDFVDAVKATGKEGNDLLDVFIDLGLSDRRVLRVLQAMTTQSEDLRAALETTNRAWDENTKLQRDSERAADTLAGSLQKLENGWTSFITLQRGAGRLLREIIVDLGDAFALAAGLDVAGASQKAIGLGRVLEALTVIIDELTAAMSTAYQWGNRLISLLPAIQGDTAAMARLIDPRLTFGGSEGLDALLRARFEEREARAKTLADQRQSLEDIQKAIDDIQSGGAAGESPDLVFERITVEMQIATESGYAMSDALTRIAFDFRNAAQHARDFLLQIGQIAAQRAIFDQIGALFGSAFGSLFASSGSESAFSIGARQGAIRQRGGAVGGGFSGSQLGSDIRRSISR